MRLLFLISLSTLVGCSSSLSKNTSRLPASAINRCDQLAKTEIHAHRGAWDRPENMLSAFLRAPELGADVVEMDLQVTKDDHVVVAHDPFLKDECRLNGKPLVPQKFYRYLTLSQVKAFDCGSVAKSGRPVAGERISSLSETLESLRSIAGASGQPLRFNIEMKFNPSQPRYFPAREKYVELVLSAVERSNIAPERFLFQSFDHEMLKVLKSKRPNARVAALIGSQDQDQVAIARSLGAEAVTPHFSFVNLESVRALHAAGIKVIPWTVNEAGDAARVFEFGVDGVITDRPELFRFAHSFCER